jgi:hypothetical protein
MAKQTIPNTGLWSSIASLLNSNFTNAEDGTGWAQYSDTQYTEIAPFSLTGNTDTILPNDGLSVFDPEKPSDITTMYDGNVITGRQGDGMGITIDFQTVPTSASTTFIEVWLDIGAGEQLYKRIVSFPKGTGVNRPINFTVMGYTYAQWEANGATVYVRSNGSADLFGMRYVLTRTHKAK